MINSQDDWQTLERFVEIRSSWLTLIGEKLQDEQQRILDYWRVEKADSVVIVTIQSGFFLLAKASYRPGVGKTTLDFPGGRVLPEQTTVEAAKIILNRELGIEESDIISLKPLNQTGWAIIDTPSLTFTRFNEGFLLNQAVTRSNSVSCSTPAPRSPQAISL